MRNRVENDHTEIGRVRGCNLERGQIGVAPNGSHWLRTYTGLACLEDGDTYTFGNGDAALCLNGDALYSTGPSLESISFLPLPAGTRIYIDVR